MRRVLALALSLALTAFTIVPVAADDLSLIGPGDRLHGADVSRWQHPNGKPINFKKMHDAGLSFVMIKASDTRYESDRLALKYVRMDRKAAQAAGVYTGFYHFAILPNVSTPAGVKKDAQAQAQKVLWRLADLGGYNDMDLPYALDLETRCIQWSSSGACMKNATRSAATLWAKTFLKTLKEKTGRTPILYSSPSFLETALNRDKELNSYPLWIAHYAIDPAEPDAKPNVKPGGCFVHSWTTKECSADWTMWQYTSCGIAPKYGVPGHRLDLNVFSGGREKFLALLTGTWQPDPIDVMPKNETSTIVISSFSASTTNKNVIINVEVKRPDSTPVVTGTVRYYFAPENATVPVVVQNVERETSGIWKLSISGMPAGSWVGYVGFTDETGTHAEVKTPLSLDILQGPTPAPKPSKKATKKPSKDSCRNQIKN
ncbi:Acm Lyzozyme M1 (1,4-beta-N-acetylmuramidase) [Candidatus Nanopelagicaceae bacterium]